MRNLMVIILSCFVFTGCKQSNKQEERKAPETQQKVEFKVSPDKPAMKWNHKSVVFIVDTSGSMDDTLDGERKIVSAKRAMLSILTVYNKHHLKKNDIEAALFDFSGWNGVKKVVPLQGFNYKLLTSKVKSLSADGGTPLGTALAMAEKELDAKANGRKFIVMLTDGMNTDGRNPEEVFGQILADNREQQDSETKLYMIAFDTDRNNFRTLERLGAKVTEAKSSDALLLELLKNTQMILEKPIE